MHNMIIFNHIPKTAGASFRYILNRQYRNAIYNISDTNLSRDINRFNKMNADFQNSFEIISGHCAQFLENKFSNTKKIVFLRNPTEQLLSTYYQIRKNPNNKWHEVSRKCSNALEVAEFLDEYGLSNLQTRFLASNEDLVNGLETEKNQFRKINDNDYLRAFKNLSEYSFIGLTEEFDKSILIFKKQLFWKTPYYIIGNKTSDSEKVILNAKELNSIERIQYYDYKLYEEGILKFRKIEDGIPVSANELKAFQFKNFIFNKLKRLL